MDAHTGCLVNTYPLGGVHSLDTSPVSSVQASHRPNRHTDAGISLALSEHTPLNQRHRISL